MKNKLKKLAVFNHAALKVGQAVTATAMLYSGLTAQAELVMDQMQPSVPVTAATTDPNEPLDLMWLDEDNIIVNCEILTNEEAFAKYPNHVPLLKKFIEDSLNELEPDLMVWDMTTANER